MLFDFNALLLAVHIIHLSKRPYKFQKDELLGQALPAEVGYAR